MLNRYALCDHCVGRQFATLGRGMENNERGETIKTALALEAHILASRQNTEGVTILKTLAVNGFFKMAKEILHKMKRHVPRKYAPKACFLCEDKFRVVNELVEKVLQELNMYEYSNFLVGVKIPLAVEEREDEFKALFQVDYGENMRNEFGRLVGRRILERTGKKVEHERPEIVVLIDPIMEKVRLQINPLHIVGRYRKLVRNIPQSKWDCPDCRGKGCKECGWTGKLYPESVSEIIGRPSVVAAIGEDHSFHAAGREDIDVRMLGAGRPFLVEIANPKRRFLDLERLQADINTYANGKLEVSDLRLTDKREIRKLKAADSVQKEYRVVVGFEKMIKISELRHLETALTDVTIRQRTPKRVSHRRAILTREKYIYEIKAKKLSPRKAEMRIRCQGGLYVKELVTGDEGRTRPSISEICKNRAEPLELDVLNVLEKD